MFSEWILPLISLGGQGTTRAEGTHGAHVRGAKRNRVDRRPRIIYCRLQATLIGVVAAKEGASMPV